MSMTPAFSPGPWITQGALVGSVRRWIFEDLYEQCSFHIAEKMPSSVSEGSRPISSLRRPYSSGLRPCAATNSGVIADFAGSRAAGLGGTLRPTGDLVADFRALNFLAVDFLVVDDLGAAFFAGRSFRARFRAEAFLRDSRRLLTRADGRFFRPDFDFCADFDF